VSTSWDYIVVGAGHNGLSAACTLAKANRSVLVVDQRPIIGGLAASHNYLESAPDHFLSLGAMDDALLAAGPITVELKLREHGYRPIALEAPYGWMNPDGDTLLLFKDFDRTVDEIRYFSANDARRYQELRATFDFLMGSLDKIGLKHPAEIGKRDIAGSLLKLASDKAMRRTLGRMLSTSVFEMISETFESEAMRGLWAFWSGMFAPATQPGGGIYLSGFANVHRIGIYRPTGGMSGLMRAFESCLLQHGGNIRLNSRVDKILTRNNVAGGIRLTGGQELYAEQGILASCAPQIALGALLDNGVLEPTIKQKLDFIPANSIDISPFKIDMATKGRLGYPKAQSKRNRKDGFDLRKTTFMTGTLEQHIAQHQACLRGDNVDFPLPLYFSILSGADPSIAPEGGDVLYLYANVPYQPVGGWDNCKEAYSDHILASVEPFIGGLDTEIGRIETTPRDFVDQFSAPRGCYFHVDMLPTRMGINRPAPGLGGYRTPVNNLYLAGSGSHPNGGVSGLPGKLAAETALRYAVA
jgi:phytoene dehydrogenase-like protein